MPRFDRDHLRCRELYSAAVLVLDMDLASRKEADVRVHAKIGTGDPLHVRGPAKSWRIHDALDAAVAGRNDINLYAADFSMRGSGDGSEKWIVGVHTFRQSDYSVVAPH